MSGLIIQKPDSEAAVPALSVLHSASAARRTRESGRGRGVSGM